MTPMTSTSKAGLTVTTSVRLIDRTGVDAANAEDRAHAPEPLRMLDDEPPKVCSGVCVALLFEGAGVLAVCAGIWIWRMCK